VGDDEEDVFALVDDPPELRAVDVFWRNFLLMLAELNRLTGGAGVALGVAGPIDEDEVDVPPFAAPEFTPAAAEDVVVVVVLLISCASVVGGGGTAGDDADDDGALSASVLVLIPFNFCVDDSSETCSISLI
jgi:hypothetical protein